MREISQIQNCWQLLGLRVSEIKALNTQNQSLPANTAALQCPKDGQTQLGQSVNQG